MISRLRPSPEELAAFPVHRGQAWLTTGRQVIFQSVYRGAGHGGRMGNFFGHALIFDAEAQAISSAAHDWSSVMVPASPETEAHVARTGDTSLPSVNIEPNALPWLPDLEPENLSSWLFAKQDRLGRLSALLHVVLDHGSAPGSKRLVLQGPITETRRWVSLLQLAVPAPWLCRIEYGDYLPAPDKNSTTIACRPQPKSVSASTFALQRIAVVVQVEGEDGWPPEHPGLKAWISERISDLSSANVLDANADHYHAPKNASQFLAGVDWLAGQKVIRAVHLGFFRDCAYMKGWESFWAEMESSDTLGVDQTLALIPFLAQLVAHPQQGTRAWSELVSMPSTTLSRMAYQGMDTSAIADAFPKALGTKLPDWLNAIVTGGLPAVLHEELDSGAKSTPVLVGHLLEWSRACPSGSLAPATAQALPRLFAAARARVSNDVSKTWLNALPEAWQATGAQASLKVAPPATLAIWLVACKGDKAPSTLLTWAKTLPSLLAAEGIDEWLEEAARQVFAIVPAKDAATLYQLLHKQASGAAEALQASLFAGFIASQRRSEDIAAGCLHYLTSAIKQGKPLNVMTAVCRTLDRSLPLSAQPPIKRKELDRLLHYMTHGANSVPVDALRARWFVACIAEGDSVAALAPKQRLIFEWLIRTNDARAIDWSRSLAEAMITKARPAQEYADLLAKLHTLSKSAPSEFLAFTVKDPIGASALIVALTGHGLTSEIAVETRKSLLSEWSHRSHSDRKKATRSA